MLPLIILVAVAGEEVQAMQSNEQLHDLFSSTLSRIFAFALIVSAMPVSLIRTAQAQTFKAVGSWTEQVLHSLENDGSDGIP